MVIIVHLVFEYAVQLHFVLPFLKPLQVSPPLAPQNPFKREETYLFVYLKGLTHLDIFFTIILWWICKCTRSTVSSCLAVHY